MKLFKAFATALSPLFLVLAITTPAAAAEDTGGLKIGTSAPTFVLPVVNESDVGKRFGIANWVGSEKPEKKLVVMSFFATYCEPCKKEMPELVRLYDKYKDQGLGVMLVSIDKGMDGRKKVQDLAKENGVPFPVVHDRFGVVGRRYQAVRLPYMLFIGPNGVVNTVHVGYTEELKAQLEGEVRTALGMPAEAPQAEPEAKSSKKGKKGKKAKGKKKGKSKKASKSSKKKDTGKKGST
jgi:thiol-disulfide isomerase/thioredoxin